MHRSTLRVHLVAGALLVALSQSLNAKAPTVRLTIAGAELPGLIETSDPAALSKYVVRYVHDPRTARGFVYLPGRGEGGYAMNAGSMLRDGQDGRWHRADPRWSDALVRALSARSSAPRR